MRLLGTQCCITGEWGAGDPATGAISYLTLGSESHTSIDEVLLPSEPKPDAPIFFTKKFAGHPEYRWQVLAVYRDPAAAPLTYIVTLHRRAQVGSQYYLKEIVVARRGQKIRSFLHPWSLVEVEFGHSLSVGKATGLFFDGNKRYVDTVQLYSMPKRRLAIVNQVLPRSREDLIQVIPISSRRPDPSEKASVEVTSELAKMVNYQNPSWAVCRMIQTVTASRVIAPLVQRTAYNQQRDKGFRQQVRAPVREELKDALMYGVAADGRVADSKALAAVQATLAQLNSEVTNLTQQLATLQSQVTLYDQLANDSGLTLEELRELYEDSITP
jgi:uncharacterized protein YifN (PemK superfamily)